MSEKIRKKKKEKRKKMDEISNEPIDKELNMHRFVSAEHG